jgi:hypothetical protein
LLGGAVAGCLAHCPIASLEVSIASTALFLLLSALEAQTLRIHSLIANAGAGGK